MVGGVIAVTTMPLINKLHVDDPVGATSVHGKRTSRTLQKYMMLIFVLRTQYQSPLLYRYPNLIFIKNT